MHFSPMGSTWNKRKMFFSYRYGWSRASTVALRTSRPPGPSVVLLSLHLLTHESRSCSGLDPWVLAEAGQRDGGRECSLSLRSFSELEHSTEAFIPRTRTSWPHLPASLNGKSRSYYPWSCARQNIWASKNKGSTDSGEEPPKSHSLFAWPWPISPAQPPPSVPTFPQISRTRAQFPCL